MSRKQKNGDREEAKICRLFQAIPWKMLRIERRDAKSMPGPFACNSLASSEMVSFAVAPLRQPLCGSPFAVAPLRQPLCGSPFAACPKGTRNALEHHQAGHASIWHPAQHFQRNRSGQPTDFCLFSVAILLFSACFLVFSFFGEKSQIY